jgi:hypothetical protein
VDDYEQTANVDIHRYATHDLLVTMNSIEKPINNLFLTLLQMYYQQDNSFDIYRC